MRVERALGRLERPREAFGPLAVVPWAMVAADRVMMRNGAAELHNHFRYRLLDLIPLLQFGAALAGREYRVVRRRPVRIGVGEAASHRALTADAANRIGTGLHQLRVIVGEAIPGDRGLESVAHDSHRDQRVAQVRRLDECVAPCAGGAFMRRVGVGARAAGALGNLSAEAGADFKRALHPRLQLVVGRFEGQHQHRGLALVGAGVGRLAGIEQAAVGWIEAGLRDRAHRFGSSDKIRKRNRRTGAELRPLLEPHPGLRDDAENSFRADEHAVGTRPGARTRQASRFDHAGRRDDAHRLHEVVDMGVERREVAARARRDPSAER